MTSRNRPSALALAPLLVGAVGCVTFTFRPGDPAIQRASKEFECPPEKIGIIERSDLATGLYDLDACGQRVRYSCFYGGPHHGPTVYEDGGYQCVREPDPPKWSPDPRAVATLPKPQDPVQRVRSSPGEARRICRDRSDLETGVPPEPYLGPPPRTSGSEGTYSETPPWKADCILLH